jgi:hypothetical protein
VLGEPEARGDPQIALDERAHFSAQRCPVLRLSSTTGSKPACANALAS